MQFADRFTPNPESVTLTQAVWVPLLAGVSLFLIDNFLIPEVFTLPLLFLIALGYLAFRLPAWMVAVWAVVYAGIIFVLLQFKIGYSETIPVLEPYMETAIFLAGSLGVALFASLRSRLEKSREALFSVIAALPSPVIISDLSGDILLLNAEARKLIQGENRGLSFFSLFSSPDTQGQTIARYINFFDTGRGTPNPLMLQTRAPSPLRLHATLTVVSLDRNRYALTVIEKVEHPERQGN